MFYKPSTQKQQAFDFYNSYEGEKVTRPTFYQRVRNFSDEPWEEKIKVRVKNQYCRRDNTPKGKWAEQMTWYDTQPEPKVTKTLFRNRLNGGYPKEEAILMGEEWIAVKSKKKPKQPVQNRGYIPKKIIPKKEDESNFKIEITYPKEVARVFRKEYVRMIEEIEWGLTYTNEKTEIFAMNKKLERLKGELEIFNCYNR